MPAALVSISPTGITFRAALANLSEKANAESNTKENGAESDSGAGATDRMASKQEKAQSSASDCDAGIRTTTTALPATVVVANGRTWHTTRTMTGVRIASTPANAPASTAATASPLNSTKQTKADNDTSRGGSGTHSNSDALTTVPVPPADQPTVWAANRSSGQDKVNRPSDEPTGTVSPSLDVPASTPAHELPHPLPLVQSVAEPAERNATAVKQLNSVPPSDGMVAGEGQESAPTIPSGMPQSVDGMAAQVAGENFIVPMELPMVAAFPSHGDWSQPAVKVAPKANNDAAGAKNPDLGSTAEPGKSKAVDALGTGSDGPSHATQNSGQSTQHSQADPSQGAAVPAKVMDSGTSQAQAALMGASHEAAMPLRSGGGVEDVSPQILQRGEPASNELESGNAATTSGINAAHLIKTMSQTEMSVGMRSSEFGNISIRTSVSQQQMLAQISLDHSELSQALSSHVSSVQTKLGNESGLHTLIEVNHQGSLSSGDSGNPAQREQQEFVRSARTASVAVAAEPEAGLGPGALDSVNDGVRLDIRA